MTDNANVTAAQTLRNVIVYAQEIHPARGTGESFEGGMSWDCEYKGETCRTRMSLAAAKIVETTGIKVTATPKTLEWRSHEDR